MSDDDRQPLGEPPLASVRVPVQWLNYNGDQRAILDGPPLGPITIGELLYPVTAVYDAVRDSTRVGLSYIAPPAEVP